MIILSNGFKKPEVGDFGDVWFPALEDNIDRVDTHTHNGVNSPLIPSSSISGVVQTVASTVFTAQSGAVAGRLYKADIVVAGGSVNVDLKSLVIRDLTTKNPIYMEYEKLSSTQVSIFSPFPREIEVLLV